MAISVRCASCGQGYAVNDQFAGRRLQCPKCHTAIQAPATDPNYALAPPVYQAQLIYPQQTAYPALPDLGGAYLAPRTPAALPSPRGRRKPKSGPLLWIAAAGGLFVGLTIVGVIAIGSALRDRNWFAAAEPRVERERNKVRPITAVVEGSVEGAAQSATANRASAYSGPSAESVIQELLAAVQRLNSALSAIRDENTARQNAHRVVEALDQFVSIYERIHNLSLPISAAESRRLEAIYEPQMKAATTQFYFELSRLKSAPGVAPVLAQSLRMTGIEQRFNQAMNRPLWASSIARPPARLRAQPSAQRSARDRIASLHSAMLSNRDGFAKFDERHVVEVVVQKLPGDVVDFVQKRVRDITHCEHWQYTHGGDSIRVTVAPVYDVRALAAAIDFGKVTRVDVSQSLLVVVAEASKLPPPLPPEIRNASHPAFYRRNLDDFTCWSDRRRRAAIERLRNVQPKELRREIAAAYVSLLKHPDGDIRRKAVEAMPVWAAADQALPDLLEMLDESDHWLVEEVIKALGRFKDPRAIGPLCNVAQQHRNLAVEALAAIGPQAEPEVLKFLDQSNPEVRITAAKALGEIGSIECVRSLEAIARGESNFFVRHEATEALAKVRGRIADRLRAENQTN